MLGKEYWRKLNKILSAIEDEEWLHIQEAAKLVANATADGGMVHVFAPGNTHSVVEEMWIHAGGLASINPILDAGMMPAFGPMKASSFEHLEGYGRVLFETHDAREGEIMIVVSNIGTLPVVVDMGLAAKEHNMKLITLASLDFSKASPARHSSGIKLYDIADIVIDNKCPPGEAILDVVGMDRRVGSATTIANIWILNGIVVEAIGILLDKGIDPPVFKNFNLPQTMESKSKTFESLIFPYRNRLSVMDFRRS